MKISINKTLFVLASATCISLASIPVYAADDDVTTKTETQTESDANGDYVKKTTVKAEDSNGAVATDKDEVKVKVNSDGSYKKTIYGKSTNDPKGLGNKSTVEAKETIKNKNGEYKDEASVKTKNGATGTKTVREGSVEVQTDSNGNSKTTKKTNLSSDPKGLMNKSTEETSETSEKKDGKDKYHYVKKVDGKTVDDETTESK